LIHPGFHSRFTRRPVANILFTKADAVKVAAYAPASHGEIADASAAPLCKSGYANNRMKVMTTRVGSCAQ
jgi:hypothetical protein